MFYMFNQASQISEDEDNKTKLIFQLYHNQDILLRLS